MISEKTLEQLKESLESMSAHQNETALSLQKIGYIHYFVVQEYLKELENGPLMATVGMELFGIIDNYFGLVKEYQTLDLK